MPQVFTQGLRVPVPGGKVIDELVGAASANHDAVSIAHMQAPVGWTEPYQTPEFAEYTIVVAGTVTVECDGVIHECHAGQVLLTHAGERVRYGVGPEGAEYYAVCLPSFAPDRVHREGE